MIDAKSSAYLLLGGHANLARRGWRLGGAANYGSSFNGDSARWVWVDAQAERTWYGPHFSASLSAGAYGLRYTNPFTYSAFAAEFWPTVSWHTGAFEFTLLPRATGGGWESGPDNGDIAVLGGGLKAGLGLGPLIASVMGESYHATNGALDGTYNGVGLEAMVSVGAFDLGGSVKRWRNPAETEWGYSGFVSARIIDGVNLDFQAARSVTDPVLASPGSFGASVGLSFRVLSGRRAPPPVADVGEARPDGRQTVFTVELPDADHVALSGSFTNWEPVPMRKQGKTFTVELAVPPGSHQYGFLVDEHEWYVPANASGLVDDGFGRKNATLVIERE